MLKPRMTTNPHYMNLRDTKDLKSAILLIENWNAFYSDKTIGMKRSCDLLLHELENVVLEDWEIAQLTSRFQYIYFSKDGQEEYTLRRDYLKEFFSHYKGEGAKKICKAFLEAADFVVFNKRIENNFSKMDNRLLMTESTEVNNAMYNKDGAINNIYDICENAIHKYKNMEQDKLFVILAESLSYLYKKNFIPMLESDVIEHVADWCIISEKIELKSLAKGLKNLKVDDKKKKAAISKVSKINQIATIDTAKKDAPILEFKQYDVKQILDDALIKIRGAETVQDAEITIRKTIELLYRVPKENITEEYPFILGFVRRVLLYGGSFAINPLLVVPVIIVDICIHQHINLKHTDELMVKLAKERNTLERRLETAKNKDKVKGYIDVLDKQIDRVDTYRSGLTSDFEKDMKMSEDVDIFKSMAIVLAYDSEIFNETGLVKTSLVRVRETLKKNTEKLSAKEKMISRNLDSSIDKFQKELESSVAVKERERVIEGKVLPSASKTIKIAIATGAVWAINPAIAVIGAIAGIALSSKANARERQMVLDDIEIHLKIVEKKIQQAEVNNDDKALTELLKLERTLTREKQRIKYRMKVYYNQRT